MNQVGERLLVFFGHINCQLINLSKDLIWFVAVIKLHFADLGWFWWRCLERTTTGCTTPLLVLKLSIVCNVIIRSQQRRTNVVVVGCCFRVASFWVCIWRRLKLKRRAQLVCKRFDSLELFQIRANFALRWIINGRETWKSLVFLCNLNDFSSLKMKRGRKNKDKLYHNGGLNGAHLLLCLKLLFLSRSLARSYSTKTCYFFSFTAAPVS